MDSYKRVVITIATYHVAIIETKKKSSCLFAYTVLHNI